MKKDKLSAGEKAIVTYAHESSDKTLKKLQAAMNRKTEIQALRRRPRKW